MDGQTIKICNHDVHFKQVAPEKDWLKLLETDISFFKLLNDTPENIPYGHKLYAPYLDIKKRGVYIPIPSKLSITNIEFYRKAKLYADCTIHYELKIYPPAFNIIFPSIKTYFGSYTQEECTDYEITETSDSYIVHIYRKLQHSAAHWLYSKRLDHYKEATRFSRFIEFFHSSCVFPLIITIPLPTIMAFLSLMGRFEYPTFWCILAFLHLFVFTSIWQHITKDKSCYIEKAFMQFYLQCFLHIILILSFIAQIICLFL